MCNKGAVKLSQWRKVNAAIQRALRQGEVEKARREAHILYQYLIDMGLLDEPIRSISTPTGRGDSDGMVVAEEVKMRATA